MHLPELSLRSRGFRGLSRAFGVRMYLGERKVTKDKTEIVAHCFLNFLDDQISCGAVGTFKVAVLNQRYRRISRTLYMVAFTYGRR
jgi:hypothetical protein